jgi:hypothetical protein
LYIFCWDAAVILYYGDLLAFYGDLFIKFCGDFSPC